MLEKLQQRKMRVYKSPVQLKPSNMQKKSSINFVKNVAAPKAIKTQNVYNGTHNNPSQTYYTDQTVKGGRQPSSTLSSLSRENQKYESFFLPLIIHRVCSISPSFSHPTRSSSTHSSQPAFRTSFPYNPQTQIKHLFSFIHGEVQNNMLYVKSDNIYVDYILGLRDFRVRDLVQLLKDEQENSDNPNHETTVRLEVACCEYANVEVDNYLRNFEIIKCVGSGGFSKVFLVRAFGRLMAMKVINKEYILSNDKANIINNQKAILSICSDHPFVTKLETSFQTKNFLIFVMEFCNGGELFNLLRKVRRMKEEDAKFYFVETLSAIVYLHRKGIVYRDIKPENIIIDYEGHVRLADYGLSKIMEDTREAKTYSFCGSAEYMAPEMLLKKGHSFQIDFYCLGALLYELVTGLPPYYSRNQTELFSNIIHNDLQFPAHTSLSPELKSFLSSLLQKQVEHRYSTIEQILSDPWMQNINLEHVLEKRLKPPHKTDMFGYNFDDSDFAEEQKEMLQKLKEEQAMDRFEDLKFPDFFYESKEISDLKSVILKSKQQGMFVRSGHGNVGEFVAESYQQSRNVSNSGSTIMMPKHSREPSINRLDHSNLINLPTSSQISRRLNTSNIFMDQQGSHSKLIYYPTSPNSKPQLASVRSLEHINTSKASITHNRSQQRIGSQDRIGVSQERVLSKQRIGSQDRIGSLTRQPTSHTPYNIYTTQKQPFHPFGIKLTSPGSSIISNSHNQTRQPNYYSVQKSSSRGDGIRLDINDLRIKNQRNLSLERPRENYSSGSNNKNISLGTVFNSNQAPSSSGYLKHTMSAYELKRSYIDSLREKNPTLNGNGIINGNSHTLINSSHNIIGNTGGNKVKKSSYRNGEKISISMLNNFHYHRNDR